MTPNQYVKKHKTDKGKFSHRKLCEDLVKDFNELLDKEMQVKEERLFKVVVNKMKQKYDAIGNKSPYFPEGIWNYFFATTVVPKRDELFPELITKKPSSPSLPRRGVSVW